MIVVDASVLIDALRDVPDGAALRERLVSDELHAPALIDYEVVSGVRRLTLSGNLAADRAEDLLTDFNDLPLHRWPGKEALRRRAFALRNQVSAYDAAYLALAEALDCALVTRDGRLARSSGHDAVVELV